MADHGSRRGPDRTRDSAHPFRSGGFVPREPQDRHPLGAGRQAQCHPHAGWTPTLQGVGDPSLSRGDVLGAGAASPLFSSPNQRFGDELVDAASGGAGRGDAGGLRRSLGPPGPPPGKPEQPPPRAAPVHIWLGTAAGRRLPSPPMADTPTAALLRARPSPAGQQPGIARSTGRGHRRRGRQHRRARRLRGQARVPRRGRHRQLLHGRAHIEADPRRRSTGSTACTCSSLSDRTFAMHEGGKIEVLAAHAGRAIATTSRWPTRPGVARVCNAIAAAPGPGPRAHHQEEHGGHRHRRHRGARPGRHRPGRRAAGHGGQGAAVQELRRRRRLPDLHRRRWPRHAGGERVQAIVETVQRIAPGVRRHQPRGHRRAAVLRGRGAAAGAARHPGLPRRPARHRGRRARRARERAEARRTRRWATSAS